MPDPPVTLRDVAGRAGVHPATASRALNPETRILVSEETTRRVLAAADELGYRPNPVARSLRTRRSHTVGVLIPDLNNPLFPPIVRGLDDRLAAAGDRKSTRLNSSHSSISYAVFCLKKKKHKLTH